MRAYGGTTGTASGDVTGLTSGTPRLDVGGAGAPAPTRPRCPRQFRLPLPALPRRRDRRRPARRRTAASDPSLTGSARIAAGSLNGLAFHDVVVPLGGNARAIDVRGGRATVGSTTLRFDGSGSRHGVRGALRSDRVDLADFNDYFDAGDTLAGRGRLALAFGLDRASVSTAGDVALADALPPPAGSATSRRAGRRAGAPSPATRPWAARTAG